MDNTSRVYIQTDDLGRVVRCEGEYTLPGNLDGWILIEEGPSCDRINLAQTHYFDGGLYTDDGITRYKLEDGQTAARTYEEIEADRAALPDQGQISPTEAERLSALEAAMLELMTGGTGDV